MRSKLLLAVSLALALVAVRIAPARAADMSGAFSIILYDPRTDEIGIGVLSHAPASGGFVPWVEAGVGAIATQGETNPSWGPRGLAMLRAGVPVEKMVDSLMHSDDGFQRRQLGALDKTGWPSGYSGIEMVNWSGGLLDTNFAAQANTMLNHNVIDGIADTVRALRDQPLAERLLFGLTLGERFRADWRGARSAAIVVGRLNPERPDDATRYLSLRVDDSMRPTVALAALYRNVRASRLVAAQFDYAAYYRKIGDAARAAAEDARARANVAASLADTATSAPALNALAWALAQRGTMLDEAWTAIERAQIAEPRSTEFTDTAAEVRYRQGKVAEALALSKEAHQRVPPDEYLTAREKFFTDEAAKAAKPAGKSKKKG